MNASKLMLFFIILVASGGTVFTRPQNEPSSSSSSKSECSEYDLERLRKGKMPMDVITRIPNMGENEKMEILIDSASEAVAELDKTSDVGAIRKSIETKMTELQTYLTSPPEWYKSSVAKATENYREVDNYVKNNALEETRLADFVALVGALTCGTTGYLVNVGSLRITDKSTAKKVPIFSAIAVYVLFVIAGILRKIQSDAHDPPIKLDEKTLLDSHPKQYFRKNRN